MPPPYSNPGATKSHTTPPWVWRGTHWELLGSDEFDCTCAQYTAYKLSGVIPGTAAVDTVTADPDNPTIIRWLENNGFTAHQSIPCGNGAPEECGCGPQQMHRCAVIYKSVPDGAVIHVAAFDPKLCDWGGKLTARRPVARFATPDVYCDMGHGDRSTMEMLFYCSETDAPYVSDRDIMRGFRQLVQPPPDPPSEPVPDEFGLFPTLRKLARYLFGSLLILGLLGLILYLI